MTEHIELGEKVKEKLRRMGYEIIKWDDAPEYIKKCGYPDVIGYKDGEYVLVEVKVDDQLRRYVETGLKLILVLNILSGEKVEVWGYKELLIDRERKKDNDCSD